MLEILKRSGFFELRITYDWSRVPTTAFGTVPTTENTIILPIRRKCGGENYCIQDPEVTYNGKTDDAKWAKILGTSTEFDRLFFWEKNYV